MDPVFVVLLAFILGMPFGYIVGRVDAGKERTEKDRCPSKPR